MLIIWKNNLPSVFLNKKSKLLFFNQNESRHSRFLPTTSKASFKFLQNLSCLLMSGNLELAEWQPLNLSKPHLQDVELYYVQTMSLDATTFSVEPRHPQSFIFLQGLFRRLKLRVHGNLIFWIMRGIGHQTERKSWAELISE